MEPVYVHPVHEYKVYLRNGWPVVQYNELIIEIPGGHKFRKLEDAFRWIDKQPDPKFKLLAESEGIKKKNEIPTSPLLAEEQSEVVTVLTGRPRIHEKEPK